MQNNYYKIYNLYTKRLVIPVQLLCNVKYFFLKNLNILLYFMNNLYSYLESVNNNNVNIYILYTCDFHAKNNKVFIIRS